MPLRVVLVFGSSRYINEIPGARSANDVSEQDNAFVIDIGSVLTYQSTDRSPIETVSRSLATYPTWLSETSHVIKTAWLDPTISTLNVLSTNSLP